MSDGAAKTNKRVDDALITATIRTVVAMSDDPNEQLTILAAALVAGCKVCSVSKKSAFMMLEDLFETITVTPATRQ